MINNGNNNHPILGGGINSETKVHPWSVWAFITWVGGLTFAAIPAAFAVGTASEYLTNSSDVPVFVPFVCATISVAIILGTRKVANHGKPKEAIKRKRNGIAR